MSKVLVTGANGFLGSWLTRTLVQQGHQVSALVRKNSDLSELKDAGCTYLYGDILDTASLESAFTGQEYVFHLAGLIAYRKADLPAMQMVNVDGTRNVIETCLKKNIKKLVHLSSVTAVGAGFSRDQVLNEMSPYNVEHLHLGYFDTKRSAEILVRKAFEKNHLDVVILNPSTIYGAGDAKKGSRGSQLKVAQGRLKAYPSGGVSVVAVEEVVSGIISAWQKGRSGERYILSGENILIKDLFAIIAEEAGVEKPKIEIPRFVMKGLGFAGDLMNSLGYSTSLSSEVAWTSSLYHWFDAGKAKAELGFNPKPARYSVANSVRWMKENGLLTGNQ